MKKLILVLVILMGSFIILSGDANAGKNDFNFSNFEADYYLSKDASGVSHLRVVESLTAEFPSYNQNKGICRYIPFTNQDGANVTLSNLSRSDIKLTRNGMPEPIYSIEKEGDFYNVCTGTDEYVTGTQEYTFEYEFSKVVTDFGNYQELYWDTNGNGWLQRFSRLTARLHFENPEMWTGKSWCYVGKYRQSGQDRCMIEDISDGVKFSTTSSLAAGENLTFDAELKARSFVVPEPENNYILVWILVIVGVGGVLLIGNGLRKYLTLTVRKKKEYYKGMFVKPEYQAHGEYGLAEMTELYIGDKKRVEVPMLLELVVNHKIDFIKGENDKWSINVKNLDGVDENYIRLLSIINGGERPVVGETIKLEQHKASTKLVTLKKTMEKGIVANLKKAGLVEEGYKYGTSGEMHVVSKFISGVFTVAIIGFMSFALVTEFVSSGSILVGHVVLKEAFLPLLAVEVMVLMLAWAILSGFVQKYGQYTEKGLKESRYMDGLKLYIEMAEAERMKMLQSVKGADVSSEGIVKLYEKLLPYAAVFGLEESWMNEMKEYCKVENIEEPDYLMHGIMASELSRTLSSASSYVSAATVMSSSGGGSSSGFSGGGGGGFSGGGGGGGGGGGR